MGVNWGPLTWRHLGAGAATELWLELIDWVDWLRERYELSARDLPPCWPNHPVAVEELTALMSAYTAAYQLLQTKDGDAVRYHDLMAAWHRNDLWTCLRRLADHADTSVCNARQCGHKRTERPQPTFEAAREVIGADVLAREVEPDARTLPEPVMAQLIEMGDAVVTDDAVVFEGAQWTFDPALEVFFRDATQSTG